MKLALQYEGKKFDIYAIVCDDGSCPAVDFLEQVKQNNPASHRSLVNVFKRHVECGPIINEEKSRHIEERGNLWEFKSRQGDRLLYFYLPGRTTVLVHGFHKGVPAKTEYAKAERMRDQYFRRAGND